MADGVEMMPCCDIRARQKTRASVGSVARYNSCTVGGLLCTTCIVDGCSSAMCWQGEMPITVDRRGGAGFRWQRLEIFLASEAKFYHE